MQRVSSNVLSNDITLGFSVGINKIRYQTAIKNFLSKQMLDSYYANKIFWGLY